MLREHTGSAHERLDTMMAALDLGVRADYARFLAIQFRARRGVEEWMTANAPSDLTAPRQTDTIMADLAALGEPVPADAPHFAPEAADPLGIAWVIAGSSLGNKAMLADLKKRTGADWPTAFLADNRMTDFWKSLRPRMERPAGDAAAAVASARETFAHFQSVASSAMAGGTA